MLLLKKLLSFITGFVNVLYSVLITLPRDLLGLYILIRIESKIKYNDVSRGTVGDVFRRNVKKHPHKACLVYEDQVWTFQQLYEYSNKVANIMQGKYKLTKGDTVALYMENRPEFVGVWLGLSKLGVITALINTNLRSTSLVHSIAVANCKLVVYGAELEEYIDAVRHELPQLDQQHAYIVQGTYVKNGKTHKTVNLNALVQHASADEPVLDSPVSNKDVIMYIYTSGTTGLPKPAIIKHSRYIAGGFTFYEAARLNSSDVLLVTLPIYHAVGCIIGVGSGLVSGITVVLRRKFSASNFWKEADKYGCTCFVYVGELCRFLVNQPAQSDDSRHSIKKAIGNGLRENVWQEFYRRFQVKCIEFYAASEGNCNMVNVTSKIGACGFVPLFNNIVNVLPYCLIRVDNNMNPILDGNGFCIRCKPGEKGLLIGMIGTSAKMDYSGYANNPKASKSKIIENVFRKGQNAFNTGDLLVQDELGFMYFCDRLGDTYRWKGENVSTIEVENVMSSVLDSTEVVVFGVSVGGQEGRAGMAVVLSDRLDVDKLNDKLKEALPTYARPVFIRLVKDVERTGKLFKKIRMS